MYRFLAGIASVTLLLASVAGGAEEAGSYKRKSISFIDELWFADAQSRQCPATYRSHMLTRIKSSLLLERFDRNPLPQPLIEDFIAEARTIQASGDSYLDSVSALINRTLTPRIIGIIEQCKIERGRKLQTEQQQNSFMSDKAKETGLTAKQLSYLMNSAFVFIPLCRGFKESANGQSRSAEMEIGVILWRIINDGESANAEVALKKFVFCSGSATAGKKYYRNGSLVSPRQYAFESAIDNGMMNLTVALQKIEEFRLSTQVTQRRLGKVAFAMGGNEGLRVDDRYRIVESIETADGTIIRKKRGWVMVRTVGVETDTTGYESWAKVIAGNPSIGSVLDEYPRIPIQLVVGSAIFPVATARQNYRGLLVDSLDMSQSIGFRAGLSLNIGRMMKVPQLFFEAAYAMGFGDATGTVHGGYNKAALSHFMNMHFEGSVVKKLYLRRFALVLKPGFSYAMVTVHPGLSLSNDTDYRLKGYALGFLGEGGVEVALAPALNIGLTAGYDYFTPSLDFTLQSKYNDGDWADIATVDSESGNGVSLGGLRLGVHIDVSLPGLPNDPIKALRHAMTKKAKQVAKR